MGTKLKLFSISLFVIFTGCATSQPSYKEKINARPIPHTTQEKQKECSYIRGEIARMKTLYRQGETQDKRPAPKGMYVANFGSLFMEIATKNIATLESRAAQIQCGAAFSSVVSSSNGGSSIHECIEACKENTNRTSTQCFDRCNK